MADIFSSLNDLHARNDDLSHAVADANKDAQQAEQLASSILHKTKQIVEANNRKAKALENLVMAANLGQDHRTITDGTITKLQQINESLRKEHRDIQRNQSIYHRQAPASSPQFADNYKTGMKTPAPNFVTSSFTPTGQKMQPLETMQTILELADFGNALAQATKVVASHSAKTKNEEARSAIDFNAMFYKTFAEDTARRVAEITTKSKMQKPGNYMTGADVAKSLGMTGVAAGTAGLAYSIATDMTTLGSGFVKASAESLPAIAGKATSYAKKLPKVGQSIDNALEATGRFFNKFHDIDKLSYGKGFRDTFTHNITAGGELNVPRLVKDAKWLYGTKTDQPLLQAIAAAIKSGNVNGTLSVDAVIANIKRDVGTFRMNDLNEITKTVTEALKTNPRHANVTGKYLNIPKAADKLSPYIIPNAALTPVAPLGKVMSQLPSARGFAFDPAVENLLMNSVADVIQRGAKKTATDKAFSAAANVTEFEKNVQLFDSAFHIRNALDGVFKNFIEKVKIGDYAEISKLLLSGTKQSKLLLDELRRAGVIGQVGPIDLQSKTVLRDIVTKLNDFVRGAHGMKVIRGGGSVFDAGQSVNFTHQDYRTLFNTDQINALSKTLIPYVKYEAQNAAYWLKQYPLSTQRMGIANKAMDASAGRGGDDSSLTPSDRGKSTLFGYTGLSISSDDFITKISAPLKWLQDIQNAWLKIFPEKMSGYNQHLGRPVNAYESAMQYRNFPQFAKDFLQIESRGGREVMPGGFKANMETMVGRPLAWAARMADWAAGDSNAVTAITAMRPGKTQDPYWANKEIVNGLQERGLFDSIVNLFRGTAARDKANSEALGQYKLPDVNKSVIVVPQAVANEWFALLDINKLTIGKDGISKVSDADKMIAYQRDRGYFDSSPSNRSRETIWNMGLKLLEAILEAEAANRPLGEQTAAKGDAKVVVWSELAAHHHLSQEAVDRLKAAQEQANQPLNYTTEQVLGSSVTQGGRFEGTVLDKMREAVLSHFNAVGNLIESVSSEGPEKIRAKYENVIQGQWANRAAKGTPASDAEKARDRKLADEAADMEIRLWNESMTRAIVRNSKGFADAIIDPIEKIEAQRAHAINAWQTSEDYIKIMNSDDDGKKREALDVTGRIQAEHDIKRQTAISKIIEEQSTQSIAVYEQRMQASAAVLKNAFESGTLNIARYFEQQIDMINKKAEADTASQMDVVGAAIPSSVDNGLVGQLYGMISAGDFDGLQAKRAEIAKAGVDADLFFGAVVKLMNIASSRAKDVAKQAAARQDLEAKYQAALNALDTQVAENTSNAAAMRSGADIAPYAEIKANARTRFDLQTSAIRQQNERSLGFDPNAVLPMMDENATQESIDMASDYYEKKSKLDEVDLSRRALWVETEKRMDKDYWMSRVSNARVATEALSGLATQLYDLSGRQSKEAFYLMKAASVATALVKGYEAAVSSFAAGTKMGGPIVGAIFAAISVAATSAQIAALMAQEMAAGGPVVGGSGRKDDVPILAMGGEFMMQKKAVDKYGTTFMSALNAGMIDIKKLENFEIPSIPKRNTGTGYADGGVVSGEPMFETKIVLENKTGQEMRMKQGTARFDGKQMVKSIILELADTDPQFNSMFKR